MTRPICIAALALLLACEHGAAGKKSAAEAATEAQLAAAKDAAAKEAAAKEAAAKEAAAKEAAAKEAAAKEAARLQATISLTAAPDAAAAFNLGFDWSYAGHADKAIEQWSKAVALDPTFLLAKAYLNSYLSGAESMRLVSAAAAAGAALPEAERTELQMIDAYKHGDGAKGDALNARLLWLAPADWRAQLISTLPAFSARKLDVAAAAAARAAELNPKSFAAPSVQGQLAFTKGDHDADVAARKRALALRPDAPALQDDLAAALLGAGKLDEAAAAAKAETKMAGAGWEAHATLAAILCTRGEWAGGIQEQGLALGLTKDDQQKLALRDGVAMLQLGARKHAEALKTIALLEQEAKGGNANYYVLAAIERAQVELDAGKHDAAIKAADEALARVAAGQLSDAGRSALQRAALLVSARAQAAAGKADGAQAAATALQAQIGAAAAGDEDAASMIAFAEGAAALAKGDTAGAVAQLAKCVPEADLCRLALADAEEKSGDKAAAAATRKSLLDAMHTDPVGLWARARAAQPAKKK